MSVYTEIFSVNVINIFLNGLVSILSCEVLGEVTGIGCWSSIGLGGTSSQAEREKEDGLKYENVRLLMYFLALALHC